MMVALIAGPCKPPRSVQGLGLPYLAAGLERAGFEARILDLYPSSPDTDDPEELDAQLARLVAAEHPAIVGMTIHTPAYAERVRLARLIRERLPDALLVAGGHHPSSEPAALLRNSEFDVCVVGEGEETLVQIAQRLPARGARRSLDWLKGMPGVVYREGRRAVRTSARRPCADTDALPFPAHHLLRLENYAPHPLLGVRSTGLVSYRGCPLACAHCCNPLGHAVRMRSPANVVDEIEVLVKGFGLPALNVYDNLFALDREHTRAVCDGIVRRKLQVIWDCWTAGDLVDSELAARLRAAGCVRGGFGAESFDDKVLRRSQRGFTAAQHMAGIATLKASGLPVEPFLMIGLPGESKESVRRTVEGAKRSGAEKVCLSVHRPWPGTPVWRNPKGFGVRIVRGPDFEAYIETERLSRAGILDALEWAREELRRSGHVEADVLRCDRYAWE